MKTQSINIQFYNLSEGELQNLRELEEQSPAEVMLFVTKKAFDGLEYATLIVETAGIFLAVIELIKNWREAEKIKKEKKAGENVIIRIPAADGNMIEIRLENVDDIIYSKLLDIVDHWGKDDERK